MEAGEELGEACLTAPDTAAQLLAVQLSGMNECASDAPAARLFGLCAEPAAVPWARL